MHHLAPYRLLAVECCWSFSQMVDCANYDYDALQSWNRSITYLVLLHCLALHSLNGYDDHYLWMVVRRIPIIIGTIMKAAKKFGIGRNVEVINARFDFFRVAASSSSFAIARNCCSLHLTVRELIPYYECFRSWSYSFENSLPCLTRAACLLWLMLKTGNMKPISIFVYSCCTKVGARVL